MVHVSADSSSSTSSDSDSSESDAKKARKSKKKHKSGKYAKKKAKRLAKKAKKAQKKAAKEAKKAAEKIKKMEDKAKKAQEKAQHKTQQAVEAARRKPIETIRQANSLTAKLVETVNLGTLEEPPQEHFQKRPPKRRRSSSSPSAPSQRELVAQLSPHLLSPHSSAAPSASPWPVPSQSPSPSPSSSDASDEDAHIGFQCANCGVTPISGPRFQCATCKDTNLCRRCYKRKDKVHANGHKFFAMKVVAPSQEYKAMSNVVDLGLGQQVKDAFFIPSSAKDSDLQRPPSNDLDQGTSMEDEGLVCFIRHAQALHNVSKEHLGTRDNPLTEEGVNECRKMRKEWAAGVFAAAELIVVSPLRRALQTAFELNGQESDRRFFITALCTERWSGRCDEGNRKSQLLHEYPWLSSWQGVKELAEIWWPMQRENEIQRVNKFLSFLQGRPERKIVVVSHGGLLAHIVGYRMTNTDHHEMKLGSLQPISAATKRRGKPLTPEGQCTICLTIGFETVSGAVCRYLRDDFTFGGCGQGLCWMCMGKVSSEIRITKEQWSSLGDRAWWMHERCMTSSDKREFKAIVQDIIVC